MSEAEFKKTKTFGILLSQIFQLALLFIAGVFVLWGALLEIFEVLSHRGPALKDILLLFIFIELGAMISIYFKTNKLSVRFLIYIAITALTRLLVVDIKAMDNYTILTITGAIVMLTISVFILRACAYMYGGDDREEED
ncbi:MAG: phosphate-starvation-inducible PsiE family protein [Gammaproteobacteria bacterium]|nr:phosphate-starvation-inducible PsiE family protein [Gammaproteobacteria bacterium]